MSIPLVSELRQNISDVQQHISDVQQQILRVQEKIDLRLVDITKLQSEIELMKAQINNMDSSSLIAEHVLIDKQFLMKLMDEKQLLMQEKLVLMNKEQLLMNEKQSLFDMLKSSGIIYYSSFSFHLSYFF